MSVWSIHLQFDGHTPTAVTNLVMSYFQFLLRVGILRFFPVALLLVSNI